MADRLLTAEQVADRFQVPASWVYAAARGGELPAIRLGRYVRFDAGALDRWIADHYDDLDKSNGGAAA